MPRPKWKPSAVRELEQLVETGGGTNDPNFERYLECPQLQKASNRLGSAVAALGDAAHHGAFTARTHTPLPAPPGWLPPPI